MHRKNVSDKFIGKMYPKNASEKGIQKMHRKNASKKCIRKMYPKNAPKNASKNVSEKCIRTMHSKNESTATPFTSKNTSKSEPKSVEKVVVFYTDNTFQEYNLS